MAVVGDVRLGAEETDDRPARQVAADRDRDRQDRRPRRAPAGPGGWRAPGRRRRSPGRRGRWRRSTTALRIAMMKKTTSMRGADAGDRGAAEAGDHQGIDGADQRLEQVLADDRDRQPEHAPLGHRPERRRQVGCFVVCEIAVGVAAAMGSAAARSAIPGARWSGSLTGVMGPPAADDRMPRGGHAEDTLSAFRAGRAVDPCPGASEGAMRCPRVRR